MNEFFKLFTTGSTYEVLHIVGQLWFLWVPLFLLFILWDVWVTYIKTYWFSRNAFVLLELKFPKEITKSPRAMEIVFNSLHNTRKGNLFEQYWDGFLTTFFSFEIASINGQVHFYVYCQKFFQNFVQSQLYAQYPPLEIKEVDDYTKTVPKDTPNENWNAWGAEIGLTKDDVYPIKTYMEMKLEGVEEEEKSDPLSSIIEFMGSMRHGENLWFQILIQGATNDWQKKSEKELEKLLGRKKFESVQYAPGTIPLKMLSAAEDEIVKAIDRNSSKLGFFTGMRFVYVAKKDVFTQAGYAAFLGLIKQFNSMNLNGFTPKFTTSVDYFFIKTREYRRQKSIINMYRKRSYFYPPFGSFLRQGAGRVAPFILNTEELATLYHFPGRTATTPTFERVESRKGEPPSNLPM